MERVHDDVCPGSAVEDVSEDVQLVDGEALNDVAESDDEVVGALSGDDGVDDTVDVCRLVHVVGAFVQQFLYDVRELFGERLSHLGACVF